MLRRRASNQYWQQTLCRDVVSRRCLKAHLGLTISRRSRARDRCLKSGHRAIDMDQPKVKAARESVVLSALLRGHCLNFWHPSRCASVTPTVAAEWDLI
jgi:hypothetical protein